jgi:hypothetical protein
MEAKTPRSVLFTVLISAVVIIAVLIAALLLRPAVDNLSSGTPSQVSLTGRVDCGSQQCQVLVSENIGDSTVDLLADAAGDHGKLRVSNPESTVVFETTITAMGVRLNAGSLNCEGGAVPACLLRGAYQEGVVGEVFVSRNGSWRSTEKPYFSDAGSVVLGDVAGDAAPEVVRVRHSCADPGISAATCQVRPVYAEVSDINGKQLGCTKKYTSPSQIRGWPDVEIMANEVKPCG